MKKPVPPMPTACSSDTVLVWLTMTPMAIENSAKNPRVFAAGGLYCRVSMITFLALADRAQVVRGIERFLELLAVRLDPPAHVLAGARRVLVDHVAAFQ